jgi:DNA-binding transcriptional LysR family regulator
MTWDYKDPVGKHGSVRVSARYSSDNWEVLRIWAVAGLGVALKSTWDVRRDLDEGMLVRLLPRYTFGSDAGIYAVYPHRRYLPAKTRVFIDFLAERFAPERGWNDSAEAHTERALRALG